ncbi:MAG: beta-hydroxyacyl-ACP dehydratase [Deltaproteobacteria bacterium]|nr:beta-hydroxyacyl-ACP dehydratase [Deltaproteobacteria bacterium]
MSGFDHATILAHLPQQEPFRFVDSILEVDDDHIVATYRFRPEQDFYRGHFPGNPITPGVILVEAMAQVGVVALGIYLLSQDSPDEVGKVVTMFTDMAIDFTGVVRPGDEVTITGHKQFFRRRKLRSRVEMKLADGTTVASGTVSGMGVTP